MIKKKTLVVKNILFYLTLILLFSNQVFSKEEFRIKANNVKYKSSENLVIAEGNAVATNEDGKKISSKKIIYLKNSNTIKTNGNSSFSDQKILLNADQFLYNINTKTIEASGKVEFTDQQKNKFYFNKFIYNENTQQGSGEDIKIKSFDGSYLQSSKGFIDKKQNIIKLKNGKFTTCYNLKNKKNEFCPSWHLSSKEIAHDKIKKKISHKHATLKIKNIPVLYTPYISHPDPSVKRQSGFLPPLIKTLSKVGRTIQVPYFWTLSEDKDLTTTPVFYFKEHSLLKTSYRQALKDGNLIIENGYSKGYRRLNNNRSKGSRNYFFVDYNIKKNNLFFENNEIKINIQRVSQENFLRVNKINTKLFKENIRSLDNFFELKSYNDRENLRLRAGIFENLDLNDSKKYTYYFPDGSYAYNTKKIENFNTNLTTFFQGRKFLDNQKQAKVRNIISLDRDRFIIKNKGLSSSFKASLYNNNIYNDNVENLKQNTNIDNYVTLGLDNTLPFAKFNKQTYHLITPRVFIKYTNGKMQNASNNNKILNYSDVFSMNRTNNLDTPETGGSLGYGIDYAFSKNRNSSKKETLYKSSFGIGQVIRKKNQNNMPTKSSLNKKSSDFAGYFKFNLYGKDNNLNVQNMDKINFLSSFKKNSLNMKYNFNIEDDLSQINKNSLELYGNYNTINSRIRYEQKKEYVGNDKNIIFNLKKLYNENYFLNFETKKNFITNNSEYHKLSFNYENDCIITTLSYNRDFYSDKDVSNSKTFIFGITIKPFSDSFAPDLTSFIE